MKFTNTPLRKSLAGVAVAAMATFSLAACSSENDPATDSSTSDAPPAPLAAIDTLTGESTGVLLDQGFADALASLKVEAGVVGTAKLTAGSLVFPITGGNVTVFEKGAVEPYVIGQIQHEGSGFSLTAGDTVVEITNLNVDPGVSRVYGDVLVNGKVAAPNAYVLNLKGATLKPLQTAGDTAILEGTKVFISPVAADLLNQTFKVDAITEDLLVGIAKITVNVS